MFYNEKFHRETLARGDESRWSFESVFPSFFAVFSLKFQHIDQTHSTEITSQNTLLNMQIVNKKGVEILYAKYSTQNVLKRQILIDSVMEWVFDMCSKFPAKFRNIPAIMQ